MFLFYFSLLPLFLSQDQTVILKAFDNVVSEPENPEAITVKEIDLKLTAFKKESRRQFSMILDLICGRSANWTEESLARLAEAFPEMRGRLKGPHLRDSRPLFCVMKKKKKIGV